MITPNNTLLKKVDGYVETIYENKHLYKRLSDGRYFNPDLTPLVPYTNTENREEAYKSFKIVSMDGKLVTVDDANSMFMNYFAEGNSEKCDEIQQKIKEAKEKIREIYTDETVEK